MTIRRGPLLGIWIGARWPETGWIELYRGDTVTDMTESKEDTLRRYAGTLVQLDELHAETRGQMGEVLEMAWGIIANAYHGDWESAPAEWRQAAEKWRDEMYHPWLREAPAFCLSDGHDYPCDTARLLHPERYGETE